MSLIIILFGVLTLVAGFAMTLNPDIVFAPLRKHAGKPGIQVAAVGVRLILGVLLVSLAGESKYPQIIEILGWLSIVAAIILAVIGRTRFNRLIQWGLSKANSLGRTAGILAMVFGLFIVYAFV